MHRRPSLPAVLVTAVLGAATLAAVPAGTAAGGGHGHPHHGSPTLRSVVEGLDGPRGVDALGRGRTLVTESDGTFSLVVEGRRGTARTVELSSVPSTGFAPAISAGRRAVYVLTGAAGEPGAPPVPGAASLFRWQWGDDEPELVADIAAYQVTDPDPDDQESLPADSNPFDVLALRDGTVLVADAAGNDVLRVHRDGTIETVARLRPRTVETPAGLPPGTPPAGTPVVSEAVATSLAVDRRGDIYVGELRGFPATPGTSQVWRIEAGSTDAVCDPEDPYGDDCRRHADGLTSVVDLAAGPSGDVYAVSLSKLSWLAVELAVPWAEVGALYRLSGRHGHHGHRGGHGHGGWTRVSELFEDQLLLPGGVDVDHDAAYLTGPVFGPGGLSTGRLRG
ncbi:ScyD/ScyE family protein [Nocardioides sp. 1609]|uniref:ScyD/ScyE family protein n=1 Tax=Nocardioides sp. 1609 TaxID=2508327 RepID=UPI001431C3DE|nr:ScyD/ScyE family protein [Nocardioides sp. 1609]